MHIYLDLQCKSLEFCAPVPVVSHIRTPMNILKFPSIYLLFAVDFQSVDPRRLTAGVSYIPLRFGGMVDVNYINHS